MRFLSTFDQRCYWLLVIVTVNVPGFTQFDTSGKTKDLGLFNPQSISHILLTLLITGVTFVFFFSRRSPAAFRLVTMRLVPILALYALFLVTSLPWALKDLALSVYRLSEWVLGIVLVVGLFASSPERTDKLTSELLFRIAAVIITIVAIVAIISPDLALESISGDTGFLEYRFGGSVYPPNTVGTLAGIALYYVILFKRGWWRLVLISFFGAALVFTYSRGALLAFITSYFLVGILFGKLSTRLLNLMAALLACVGAMMYQEKIVSVLSRGGSTGSLTAASGRLMIWAAGIKMFMVHPFRGWGFISGVRRHVQDYYQNSTFAPQHLHNEILQAIVSGGVFAGILLLFIFFTTLVRGFRQVRASMWQQFLLCAFIQIFFHAVEGPVFSAEYMPIGACALICVTSLALVQYYGLPREPEIHASDDRQARNALPVLENAY
jgi:O-antigen ligase